MREYPLTTIVAAALTLLFLSAGAVTWAQSTADFDLTWHVVGSGGAQSSSASYQVAGTVGQSLAGPSTSSSADFIVAGGFWADTDALPAAPDGIYLPLIRR